MKSNIEVLSEQDLKAMKAAFSLTASFRPLEYIVGMVGHLADLSQLAKSMQASDELIELLELLNRLASDAQNDRIRLVASVLDMEGE